MVGRNIYTIIKEQKICMPKKILKTKKPLLKQELPLLFLLLILMVVLLLSFLMVLKKYFVLKLKYRNLLRQTQTVIVKGIPSQELTN
jgi:hypothetical protein